MQSKLLIIITSHHHSYWNQGSLRVKNTIFQLFFYIFILFFNNSFYLLIIFLIIFSNFNFFGIDFLPNYVTTFIIKTVLIRSHEISTGRHR